MTKEEFELLFNAEVVGALGWRGFNHGGNSLYATENLASVSLIRLGGRVGSAGRNRALAPLAAVDQRVCPYCNAARGSVPVTIAMFEGVVP